MAEENNNTALLRQVCFLSCRNRFDEARKVIYKAAKISDDEAGKVSYDNLRALVSARTANKKIHQMLDVEQAMFDTYQALHKRTIHDEPTVAEAESCIYRIEKILPHLSKDEKIYAKYQQSLCCAYTKDSDERRYQFLNEVIKGVKKGKPRSDERYYNCAVVIFGLDIPSKEKYEALKSARKKTSAESPFLQHYDDMMPKVAEKYYDTLMVQIKSTSDYAQIRPLYETAIVVADDLPFEEERKNANKLYLYGSLTNLQRQYHDMDGYDDNCRRQQSLIYKQARLKKRNGTYDYPAFDRFA